MKTSTEMRKYQKRMKRKETASEHAFRKRLTDSGLDHKRQVILGFYIIDFVIPSRMAVIEIDGKSHDSRQWYDAKRDELCIEWGFRVFRVRNDEVWTFPLEPIKAIPAKHEAVFRRSLGLASAYRSAAVQKLRAAGKTYNGR